MTFSSNADLSIKFNDHYRTSEFNDAVDNIPLMGLHTRIDKALRLTQTQMFTKQHGARVGVNKMLILLTDGTQTWDEGAEDPILIAEGLRKSGIHVIVIGIGDEINYAELNGVAGGSDRVFTVNSFDEMITKEFIEKISLSTCTGGKCLYILKTSRFTLESPGFLAISLGISEKLTTFYDVLCKTCEKLFPR